MNDALIVGLGTTGVLLLRRLKALGTEIWGSSPPWVLLGFDLAPSGTREGNDGRLPALTSDEFVSLSSREARTILADLDPWREHIDWLPPVESLRTLDDLSSSSAGNYRWLGRLTLLRAQHGVIRPNVQAALRRLAAGQGKSASSLPTKIMVLASLAGGTGSGVLVDMGRLLASLAQETPLLGYLLLPQASHEECPRSWGNTYATLRELAHLKKAAALSKPPDACLNGEGSQDAWARFFLFAPAESEEPLFLATLDRMALAIMAPFQPLMAEAIRVEVEHDFRLGGNEKAGTQDDGRCFSSCGALILGKASADISSAANPVAVNSQGEAVTAGAPPRQPADAERKISVCIEKGACAALDLLDETLRARIHEILDRYSQEEGRGTRSTNEELHQLSLLAKTERSDQRGLWWWWVEALYTISRKALLWRKHDLLPRAHEYTIRLQASALDDLLAKDSSFQEVNRSLDLTCVDSCSLATNLVLEKLDAIAEAGNRAGVDSPDSTRPEPMSNIGINWVRLTNEAHKLFRSRWARPWTWLTPPSLTELHQNISERASLLLDILDSASLRRELVDYFSLRIQNRMHKEIDGGGIVRTEAPAEAGTTGRQTTVIQQNDAAPPAWSADSFAQSLWQLRNDVLIPKTPRSERNSFALILFPGGQPESEETQILRSYVSRTVQEALQCRCRIVDHPGQGLWIYHEDLFHAPVDIRHLDRFRQGYAKHARQEIFHRDYRLLNDPCFLDLLEPLRAATVFCGNPNCREDIAGLPRGAIICLGCNCIIRSRCGNPNCLADDLHARPEGRSKLCPVCHGFNFSAWWRCTRHGNKEALVPVDKERCPACIQAYHDNPDDFPLERIARRPDVGRTAACPRCAEIHRTDLSHVIFMIPDDLLPFYVDGVDGVNRERYCKAVERYRIVDGCRCPQCYTILIPVYHDKEIPKGEAPPAS